MAKSNKDTTESEYMYVVKELKKLMKAQGMSYRDLAKILGLSESGVKKIFYGSDCSFRRLSQIAKALDCRLIDIMDQIDRNRLSTVQFNKAQQDFFLKNQKAFHLFVNLVVERQELEKVQKLYNLGDSELFKILKKLDDLKLLKLMPNNQVKLPKLSQVLHFGSGELLEKAYKELVQRLAEIDQEFLRRTIREMSAKSDDLRPIRWISMIDQNSLTVGPIV